MTTSKIPRLPNISRTRQRNICMSFLTSEEPIELCKRLHQIIVNVDEHLLDNSTKDEALLHLRNIAEGISD